MKFLYFGDRHNTFKNPPSRIDDYQETCENKDNEIIEIGRKNNVAAFLQPGDFFNEKDINGENEFIQKVISKWGLINIKELIDSIRDEETINPVIVEKIKNYIPLVGIVGNHDLIGNNIESLKDTTTGLLSSLGLINLATKENPIFFTTEDGLKVAITGTHYHLHMDESAYLSDYIIDEKLGDIHIHIVHGMLSEKDMGPLIKHTLIDKIKDTKADITLCGHNHVGFGIFNIDDKYFVNIGSVTRVSNDLKEVRRTPSVALIDISKSGVKVEEIPLKSALPGEEVLDRSWIEEDKKKKALAKRYREEAKEMKKGKGKLDMSDFISSLAVEKDIPDEIKDDILNRLTIKEKENLKFKTVKIDAYIKKVVLENFQSHKYSEFELSPNFNVFVGESRQGKSAILRAISWVYENKPSGKSFIKRGETYAKVSIYMSNGVVISRIVEEKRSGRNGYDILYPDGTSESGNTKLLEKVQRLLGFNYFYVDNKLSLPVNFYKQGDSWYLIGDKISSTDKARAIGALNGTNISDAVVRDLDNENGRILDSYKISKRNIEELNEEIESYDYLEDLNLRILENEKLLNKYKELCDKKDKIKEISKTVTDKKSEINRLKNVISKLNNLNDLQILIDKTKDNLNLFKNLNEKYERYLELKERIRKCNERIDNLSNIELLYSKIDIFKEKINLFNKLSDNYVKYLEFRTKVQKQDEIIDKTINIKFLIHKIDNLKENSLSLEKHKILLTRLNELIKEIDSLKIKSSKQDRIIKGTNNINSLSLKVGELKNKNSDLEKANILLTTIKDLTKQKNDLIVKIKKQNNIINETNNLEDLYVIFNKINALEFYSNNIQETKSNYDSLVSKINEDNVNVIKAEKELKESQDNYKKVLKETNICPICKNTFDDHQIEHIVME